MSENENKLSDEQIENWRKTLCGMIGPYALIMPKEEVQAIRDKMQENVNDISEESYEQN